MAFYINDKQIVENIDINYIISYFKNKGEDCVRILHGRYFDRDGQKYELTDTIIIEPLDDKVSYVYQDGHRTFALDRNYHIEINILILKYLVAFGQSIIDQ